jgi:hypothetical protein
MFSRQLTKISLAALLRSGQLAIGPATKTVVFMWETLDEVSLAPLSSDASASGVRVGEERAVDDV